MATKHPRLSLAKSENTPAVPISAAYWVLPGRLLAGEHPMLQDQEPLHVRLQRFSAANISLFIDLTEQDETHELGDYLAAFNQGQLNTQPVPVRYHAPIPDMQIPSIAQMQAILARIIVALDQQQTVYVHCWGGLGRTGTVLGCLLVHHGWEYAEALAHIAALRQGSRDERYPSPSNDLQRQFVADWRKQIV
ncbi:protein-tyrosine phosphatase family protein [Herpetosiphon giganteus]|uniref:protein-tyrosine phosphatase family protein n=1 Tax=Herpetosiphon giganteus TaxID=2029754 RepID=UPI0019593616|nr:dual specificity protein phosphatase family protein [Herpetosiphon giganteus]MBM7842595.1 protein-tyrosine phosphatase [Herpetosiphon giganteus]